MSEKPGSFAELYEDLMGHQQEPLRELSPLECEIVTRVRRAKELADGLYARLHDADSSELATLVCWLGEDLDAAYSLGVTWNREVPARRGR